MTLRLVYRSYGGENSKLRPPYFSKLLTLMSFARAASRVPDADVIFVNDGPVPVERLKIMKRFGRVIQMGETAAGLRASYRYCLELPDRDGWPDDDVVSYNEDDYLFLPEAFEALMDASLQLSEAAYFALYGTRPAYRGNGEAVTAALPRTWRARPDHVVAGRRWFNMPSTTSTFSARLGPLRADLDIFYQCMRPFRRRLLDHETCLLYQSVVPHRGIDILRGLPDDPPTRLTPRAAVVNIVLIPYRVAMNRRAGRQREPHLLYTITPNLATHLEYPVISPDHDWAGAAVDVGQWAIRHGLPTPFQDRGPNQTSSPVVNA